MTLISPRQGYASPYVPGALKLITGPATEPVALSDVEAYAGVAASTANDSLVTTLIAAARRSAEAFTRRAFIAQTWDFVLDNQDSDPQPSRMLSNLAMAHGLIPSLFELPLGQLTSVTGIYVTDDAAVETTVDPTLYFVDTSNEPGRVSLVSGNSWPGHRVIAGFRVRFVAGWANAGLVPDDIRLAIMRTVRYQWEQRSGIQSEAVGGASVTYKQGSPVGLPEEAKALLQPHRLLRI